MQFPSLKKMNTPLLAALVAAAFAAPASAQINVRTEGLVDAYVGSMRYAGEADRATKLGSNGMTTSYFGFTGTEDLGNGLKATFALTAYLRPDTGETGRFPGNDSLFSRDANVGLAGSFGAISVGRGLAPNFLPSILFNPFGNSFTFSPLMVHLHSKTGWGVSSLAGDTGWSNQVKYTTPTIAGVTANVHYQFGEEAGNSGKNNVGANVLYANGPLSLAAFVHRVQVNNPLDIPAGNVKSVAGLSAGEQKAWFVGAGYDFKVAKLTATFNKMSHDVDFDDKTVSVGASAPFGKGQVLAAWAQTERTAAGVGERKRKTASVGYDYFLSRRTDLYTVFMNDKVTGAADGNSLAAGIRHKF
jgi:predicted porin